MDKNTEELIHGYPPSFDNVFTGDGTAPIPLEVANQYDFIGREKSE